MFDVIHSDVWRPLAVFNHAQFKYYVFSLMITVIYMGFLMKERTEVFSKFMSFANEIKTLYSTTLKIFQFDNTLEYTSSTVKQYLNSYGIIHETSCAYTPQRNGVANVNIGTHLRSVGVLCSICCAQSSLFITIALMPRPSSLFLSQSWICIVLQFKGL